MQAVPSVESKQIPWQTIILFALGFWLSSIAVLNHL
jgi:di/tricarboxylate transporter